MNNLESIYSFLDSKSSGSIATNELPDKFFDNLNREKYEVISFIDSDIKLSDFRKEITKCSLGSSRKKVFAIDRAHALRSELYNTILKTLEEPRNTFFIFFTDSKLPTTIASRLVFFNKHSRESISYYSSLNEKEVIEACEQEPDKVLKHLIEHFINIRSPFLSEVLDLKKEFSEGFKIETQLMILLSRVIKEI